MSTRLKCLLVVFFAVAAVVPASAVTNYRVSNYGGGHQIWFEAENFDERNPPTEQYYPVVDQAGAFGKAVTRAGGAGGMIRWTFDISTADGKGGTWYFWGRVLSPNNQSDYMLVEGDPDDTVIPAGPPFPGGDGAAPFDNGDDRIFEETTTSWTWIRSGHEEGHTKVLRDGENTMRVYHRQGDNTVFWDTFVWTDSASYVPTDDDYRNARLQGMAGNPNPADGAIGVTMPLLSWTPAAVAVFHDVYFGTDPNPPLVAPKQLFAMYYHVPGLQPGTTYYWKVDEIEADGTVHPGPIWSFSSEPLKNYLPAPADAATGVLPGLFLTWKPGKDAAQCQVYFGTDQAAVTSGAASVDKGKVTDPKFDSGALRASTTYYWRADVIKADQSVVQGDVWSFSTADAGPTNKIQAEVWLNIGSGTAVTDLTSNPRYPSSPDTTEYLDSWLFPPGSTGGSDWANNYGDRLYGWLKPEQTGDYTFWIAGDDLSELWLSTDGSPTNATVIAQVTGWTDAMDWDATTGSTNAAAMKSAPITLEAGKKYFIMTLHKEGGGGDSVGVAWQGPGIAARTLLSAKYVDMFYLAPLQAFGPSPANGAVDVIQSPVLSWNAGDKAQKHDVYLGDDKDAVAAADTSSPLFMGSQTGATYNASDLEWGKTYYWRVDETNAGEADSPWKGAVWSFTTANFIPVDDFESYNDDMDAMTTIFDTWIDGVTDGLSNSTVGNFQAPFAEQTIVHGGKQSMPMDFDNTKAPFFSETVREFAPLQNWTVGSVTDLSLWVRGYPAPQSVAVTEAAGKITLTGDGTDIWNNSDQFTFAYKTLNGDGSMTARVVSIGPGSNTWAKAGVMIRDSLDGGSTHAMTVMTANSDGSAGNGASFQWRPVADGASSNSDSGAVVAPPYWVKIDRLGDNISGWYSADGKMWRPLGVPQTIAMNAPVYIGLCVTSHAAGEQRTFEFDSISTTGGVTGSWQGAVIDSPRYNGKANLYVTVEDSAGKSATASDPALANAAAWTEWKIPLGSLTGVNLAKVKKLYIGVGDKASPVADGAGRIYIDDIRVSK